KYTEITLKAIETLLQPFGYDVERLKEVYGVEKPTKRTNVLRQNHIPFLAINAPRILEPTTLVVR
ncbi:MAG: hypothetical protein AABZ61_13810, partial [Bacteroidota bacterium]